MGALFDRVSFATATTGTGTINVGAAATNYRTPASANVPTGTLVSYVIEDGSAWETGQGVLTSGTPWTMTRVLKESSSGSLLNLTGSATVSITALASDLNSWGALVGSRYVMR